MQKKRCYDEQLDISGDSVHAEPLSSAALRGESQV